MRTIPPRDTVAKTLARIGKVDRVRLDGWLVDTELPDGRWTSSSTRDDTGAHACELAYVCSVTLR